MNNQYKLFIFDFDGTLGDTKECVVASFQQSLVENNLPKVTREQIIHSMGLSLPISFRKLTNNALDDNAYDNLVAAYRKYYRKYLTKKTLIFPKVKETLKKLKEQGKFIAIATSKKTEFARLSCQYLAIDPYFDLYIGDDLVEKKKPDPEMLHHILRKLDIKKLDAVMIGDSTFDIEMGNAIGMETIAVTWGAHTAEALQSAKPTYMINTFSELLHFVK